MKRRSSMRPWAIVAAPMITLLANWSVPASAGEETPIARAVTVISGPAGASTIIHLSRAATLNNAGADVKLTAPRSRAVGVGLVRIDHRQKYAGSSYYVESYGTDLGMCGGSPCPVPLPIRAYAWGAQDEGPIRLSAGDYLVVLLAERGSQVRARIQLHGEPTGILHRTARGPQFGRLLVDAAAGSVDGHDLVSRGYHMHYAKSRLLVGQMGMFSFASPGALNYQTCGDIGDGPPAPGPTPCLDGGGALPTPIVAANVDDTVIGTGAAFAEGPPNGHYGLGYTISVSGPDPSVQRIRVADYQIALAQ